MIKDAPVTGARALQDLLRIQQYLESKDTMEWFAEAIGSLDASSLTALLAQLDQSASTERTSQLMLELSAMFCAARDQRYANRSRKWLYTRAYKSKAQSAYEQWSAFVKENQTQDLTTNFLAKDPKALSEESFETLLALTAQTKLAQAVAYLAGKATT